ncbi:MAG: ORF6N domain-containing protein [Candidatus Omnitrophica bacterium]|jgi:hypothetical protein|nr:ORF6N domain-containing protein [Candidatus Omnitrophota bacterium]
MSNQISVEMIAARIFEIRNKKVMLDKDLAKLYEVETRVLNQAVKRNITRFPEDFMFILTRKEVMRISQFVISLKFSKTVYAFTEQGVAMLSSVLNSERAIQVNIQIMRAFTQLRRMLLTNHNLRRKIEEIEKKYDKQFAIVFQAIKQLIEPPLVKEKRITGFR